MALDQVIGHLKILLYSWYFFYHRHVHVFLALDQVIGRLKIIFYRPQPFMYFDTLLVLAKIKFQQQKKGYDHCPEKKYFHILWLFFCIKYIFCWKTGPGLCVTPGWPYFEIICQMHWLQIVSRVHCAGTAVLYIGVDWFWQRQNCRWNVLKCSLKYCWSILNTV